MKRFYKTVAVEQQDGGYSIVLDTGSVKTPGKRLLLVNTESLAAAIAEEWVSQETHIKPDSMPLTQLSNTALDRVTTHFDHVVKEIAGYGGTDLLCYRADEPEALVQRQAKVWDPFLEWSQGSLEVTLSVTQGIMPARQSDDALTTFERRLSGLSPFELTAMHQLTSGFGSLVLAFACAERFKPFNEIWSASIVDQTFQEEEWGEDWEVVEKRSKLKSDLEAACRFLDLYKG